MSSKIAGRTEAIRDEVTEENLRAIAEYSQDGYQFQYLCEKVDNQYSTKEFDEIFNDLLLETMRSEVLEQRFNDATHEFSALGFEEMVLFQFVRDEFDGVLVSIEKDCTLDLDSFVETCFAYI